MRRLVKLDRCSQYSQRSSAQNPVVADTELQFVKEKTDLDIRRLVIGKHKKIGKSMGNKK